MEICHTRNVNTEYNSIPGNISSQDDHYSLFALASAHVAKIKHVDCQSKILALIYDWNAWRWIASSV